MYGVIVSRLSGCVQYFVFSSRDAMVWVPCHAPNLHICVTFVTQQKKTIIHWATHKIFRECPRKSSRLWDAHNIFLKSYKCDLVDLNASTNLFSSLAYSCM